MDLHYPAMLQRWLSALKLFNLSLDIAAPECSIEWTFTTKLQVTLALPVALVVLMVVFGLIQVMRGTPWPMVKEKLTLIASFSFSFLSIFYLKTIIQGLICTDDGFLYAQPDIACNSEDQDYVAVLSLATTGIIVYGSAVALVAVSIILLNRDAFYFWTDKYKPEYYYWELVVVARKVSLMLSSCAFVDAVELGWLLGVLTLVASSIAHAYACPYLDHSINVCDSGALAGAVLTYLAGLVFTFEKVTCDADENDSDEQCLSALLEYFAAAVIAATCVMTIAIEVKVVHHVRRKTSIGLQAHLEHKLSKLQKKHESSHAKRKAQADKIEARLQRLATAKVENKRDETEDADVNQKDAGKKGKKGKKGTDMTVHENPLETV